MFPARRVRGVFGLIKRHVYVALRSEVVHLIRLHFFARYG